MENQFAALKNIQIIGSDGKSRCYYCYKTMNLMINCKIKCTKCCGKFCESHYFFHRNNYPFCKGSSKYLNKKDKKNKKINVLGLVTLDQILSEGKSLSVKPVPQEEMTKEMELLRKLLCEASDIPLDKSILTK